MLRCCLPRRAIAQTLTKDNYTLSRLSNGLRVLTCDDGNGITGMGLFMLNGTKFEDETNTGAVAVFETLPLRSNQILTGREISEALGSLGNAFKVTNNKEALSVMLMLPRYHQRDGLELLNSMCLHPTQDEAEFYIAKEKAAERALLHCRDATSVCLELVHEAGWNGKGLGQPLNPTKNELDNLTLEKFTAFHRNYTRPERTVLAATGVADHKQFAADAERLLKFDCEPAPLSTPCHHPYTGGSRLVQKTEAPESMNKFQEKNLSHVALFSQGVPMNHPDYYNISVIQTLLGGGTSFSSGGPGKGMQTKLFREVLNKEGFLHGLECITAWYSDGGLIGLYGSAPHEYAYSLLKVMVYQTASICQRVSPLHLEMAKNQLRSQLILLGEGREQLLSDMGFNMVVHNHIITANETVEGTQHITIDGLKRVCAEIIRRPLTFVVYGETTNMPSHEKLEEAVRKMYERLN
ncbi:mitochondrial processing peptidase alpha subunit [Trypanosoma rangeli]|uniref:Mitochondrial processing peptidase alpha subunit n=1 Tax=Trypanosoma rangeli TaxID=5698 RepID=A0A422N4E4_TRYRA|nr:mitochondrial processing peptidase alpha subunit [Trypanosoma rangeli]RNF00301.1 mitochondrial processing peptidase alpha subunit [Trypanosoma rangeli]|eukprot:RNF00301.1 mitochondrial processing peptidase alpha subunit [Trypanosoma rangeli]